MQAFDRLRVLWGFREDCKGEIVHRARISI
jgi:hypothetical protein